jgi:ribose-phosphate pyrophosphokinase
MMLFLAMPGSEDLANRLAELCSANSAAMEVRQFPDGEDYVRVRADVAGRNIFLVSRLSHPGRLLLPLVFAARTIRGLGASRLTLVAPYLPYLRQDQVFQQGEALSSKIFADLLGREFDELMTVDPHLHRYTSLDQVYAIPTMTLSSAGLIGAWVRDNVESPVILGPDVESRQWAERVAAAAGAPWAVFEKERHGDRNVSLSAPDLAKWLGRTPVLIDDVIASGTTMVEAAKAVTEAGLAAPYCIGIHGLLDRAAGKRLEQLARRLLTTDTVVNPYSHFEIAPEIARAIAAVENHIVGAPAE